MEKMEVDKPDIWETVGDWGVIQINFGEGKRIYTGEGIHAAVIFDGLFDEYRVAVKRIDHQVTQYKCEVDTLRELDHKNIVRYLFKDKGIEHTYIVMQRCVCSLEDWLGKQPRANRITLMVIPTMKQITKGLRYLHTNSSKRIIHRDLHPSNVLLSVDNGNIVAKISDFGVTKEVKQGLSTSNSGTRGSDCYEAPEIMNGERISEKTDVFSLGLIFYNIAAPGAQHPYGKDDIDINRHIQGGEPPNLEAIREVCNGYLKPLVESMLAEKRKDRPGTSEILAHYLFWDEEKTIHFFQNASDYTFGKDDAESVRRGTVRGKLEDRTEELLGGGGWFNTAFGNLPAEKQTFVKKHLRNANPTGTVGLLRQIRNLAHHYEEKPVEFREIIGETKLDMPNFFSKHFPFLLPHTYEALRDCKTRGDFTQFYQVA